MKKTCITLFTITLICFATTPGWSQCEGYITEETPPPAVMGMSTEEPGFSVRYWSWGEFPTRNGGSHTPVLQDFDGGIMLQDMEWAGAENCLVPGEVSRTALLFESLDGEGFGRWALVNIGETDGEGADVDYMQYHLGQISSRARPIPSPEVQHISISDETVTIRLEWESTPEAEALSDLQSSEGEPLISLRGWAIYIIDDPVPTPFPEDWTLVSDQEGDAVHGYSTNTTAEISLPRSIWHDESISIALAPTFDGNGDASGDNPLSRSVRTLYLGHPCSWIALPEEGNNDLVHIEEISLQRIGHGLLDVAVRAPSEISGTNYRISLLFGSQNPFLLSSFEGGLGYYEIEVRVPEWATRRRPRLLVEMLDSAGHLLDSRVISRPNRNS